MTRLCASRSTNWRKNELQKAFFSPEISVRIIIRPTIGRLLYRSSPTVVSAHVDDVKLTMHAAEAVSTQVNTALLYFSLFELYNT